MEEARTVLARLDRIEALDRAGAPPTVLLGELRALVDEAETWARRERDPRAASAVVACAETLVDGARPAAVFETSTPAETQVGGAIVAA